MPPEITSLESIIHEQIRAGRIGRPVFARWTETTRERSSNTDRAIEAVTRWFGGPPDRQTSLGSPGDAAQTLLCAWDAGQSAVIATGAASAGSRPALDVAVLGSSGAIYHAGEAPE